MKKLIMVAAMALSAAAMAAMSLADARGKIGEVVSNPAKMAEIMQELSDEDQVAFLAEVNAAIEKLPASIDERTAKYLDVNVAAMKSANSGNLQKLLAETFATVPPEALTIINERFASDLFNRTADPTNPLTDEEFTARAQETMKVVQERAAKTDEAGVRSTFALLMFVRASNGSPADLSDTLASQLDPSVQEVAKSEWIPAALGRGVEQTYEPMLGAANAGAQPVASNVIAVSTTEGGAALLAGLGSQSLSYTETSLGLGNLGLPESSFGVSGLERKPMSEKQGAKWSNNYKRGESIGYFGQTID